MLRVEFLHNGKGIRKERGFSDAATLKVEIRRGRLVWMGFERRYRQEAPRPGGRYASWNCIEECRFCGGADNARHLGMWAHLIRATYSHLYYQPVLHTWICAIR